jgi:3-methyl-2-oxobutanoate hydroxymethyltransferase
MGDAKALEEAGCFSMVFEKIPSNLAKQASESLVIPTIGIGAGPHCDGQVLVLHDMLGITKDFSPRFLRRYADVGQSVGNAVGRFIDDVRSGNFPDENESY